MRLDNKEEKKAVLKSFVTFIIRIGRIFNDLAALPYYYNMVISWMI